MKWDKLSEHIEMGLCKSVRYGGLAEGGHQVGEEQERLLVEKDGFLDSFGCT